MSGGTTTEELGPFVVNVEFEDCVVTLGSEDDFFVKVNPDFDSATLNADRLALISALQRASE